jgi:anion-transporting  ArsA/GET3 family ATPase
VTSAPDPPLIDRRLCFVLGKGGAGKTTVAAAMGLNAAARGLKTLVIEVASQHRMTEMFAARPSGERHRDAEVELAPGLWTISIDPEHATEEYLATQLKVRPVVEMLTRSRAFTNFAQAAPGLAELVTLGKTWSLAVALKPGSNTPVWDRLIVDLPATGHGIALLETAQNIEELAGGGPIKDQAARIRQVVSHPGATGIAVVARPEELSVTEGLEAVQALRDNGLPVAAAVMNGMRPARFGDGDEAALSALAASDRGPVATAARLSLRQLEGSRHDRGQLERLRDESGLPVTVLPQLVRRNMGTAGLEMLAGEFGAPT